MRYRKKPVVIDAFRLGFDDMPEWFGDTEAEEILHRGDWIIRGIDGKIYPCKHEVFTQLYEVIEDCIY